MRLYNRADNTQDPCQFLLRPFQFSIMEKQDTPILVPLKTGYSVTWWFKASNLGKGKKFHIPREV